MCKPYAMAVSVIRSQTNERLMGNSGAAPETSFPQPSTKHNMMEFLVEERCRIPPTEFQTLVESMLRCIEDGLARGAPMSY
jgi:hypothetical protein